MKGMLIDNSTFSYRDGTSLSAELGCRPHKSTRFLRRGEARCQDRLPELYRDRSECCGCTACRAACPLDAISMLPDEEGFEYPAVDAAVCIGCGKCVAICPFKKHVIE